MCRDILFQSNDRIEYLHDASGVKRKAKYQTTKNLNLAYWDRKELSPADILNTLVTNYYGNKVYENDALKRIYTEEGYIAKEGNLYKAYYYLKDHLGSIRAVMDEAGNVIQKNYYYPFGLLTVESTTQEKQPLKYNGKELEKMQGMNWYDYSARLYDPVTARFLSMDPMAEKYYSISPYAYCMNNPVRYIDPNGMATHTDSLGHVVAVYNNDDMGVYKHNISADSYDGSELSADGATKMGETEYWDEFSPLYAEPNADGSPGNFTIQFGKSFDPIIEKLHTESQSMNLMEIASESKGGGKFDIKRKYVNTGGLLNRKYATSRSAGNYLAGYNASTGTYWGVGISFSTFQQLAGALHLAESSEPSRTLTATQKQGIVLFGGDLWSKYDPRFRAPLWGEVPYQYRMSKAGWNHGKK